MSLDYKHDGYSILLFFFSASLCASFCELIQMVETSDMQAFVSVSGDKIERNKKTSIFLFDTENWIFEITLNFAYEALILAY